VDLVRQWLRSLSWVPKEFHEEVVIGDFTRHFLPFYHFDVTSTCHVSWNSAFVFTDALSSRQTLKVTGRHSSVALAAVPSLYTPLVEALVRVEDKLAHVLVSKVPLHVPVDVELVWKDKGERSAVARAAKSAEARVPPPLPLCRNEDVVVVPSVEAREVHLVGYPVAFSTYTYRGHTYRVVLDGFSKEVTGEKPFGLSNRKWTGLWGN